MPLLLRLLLLFAAASLVATACSDDDEPAAGTSTSPPPDPTVADDGDGGATPEADVPIPPDVIVDGPIAGTPQTSSTAGMDATGYVEEEFFVSGTAAAFEPDGPLADDGRWTLTERPDAAAFTTRILVRRPADAADASGVVLVEWNNVSAGFDSTPDWSYTAAEIMRSGHVHVGVSAQKDGVDAEPGGGLAGGFGNPLVTADPERYGELSHPGDDHSYDLFAQIGALAATPPPDQPDPLAGLSREHVVAVGESQSAFRLTSFINGVHPLRPVFDGFLVHSRGGGAAPIVAGTDGLRSSIEGAIRIRDDLDTPVMIFTTETDLTRLGYASARQRDSELVHSWEIAGTAHADAFLLGGDPRGAGDALGCAAPVNDGPQHLALKAALAHLVGWVVDGTTPPTGAPIELTDDGEIERDADGNARGGIRLPPVEVPAASHSGDPSGEGLCALFGSTVAFAPEELQARYGTKDDYLAQIDDALDRAVDAGFLLDADRETALDEAREYDFG